MSGPRFKLDLVTYDDPAVFLPLPLGVEPSRSALLQPRSNALDMQMAQNRQLVEQLNTLLTGTDISFVHPVSTEVATTLNPSSHLAKTLVGRNPYLFQYGMLDVEAAATPMAGTPGPSGAALAAHNSQPDPQSNPPTRKQRAEAAPAASERKRARKEPKQEVYVLSSDEVQAAAGKLSALLEATLATAAGAAAGQIDDEEDDTAGYDQEEEEEAGGAAQHGGRPRYRFRLEGLRQLHQELLTAQAQGYLRLVPSERLQALLAALHDAAGTGRNVLVAEDAELKSRPVARVAAALEAVLCELVLLSTPRLPAALYLEEQLGRAVELTKYHLQYNVLALHDVRFRRLYRPGSLDGDAEEFVKAAKTPRGRGARATAGHHLPRWCALVAGRLEQALGLLAEVASGGRLAAEGLIPLVRVSQQALTVDSLQTLHYRALGLAVSLFRSYPQQRSTVLDEFVQSVMSCLSTGKHVARHYPLRSVDRPTSIQMSTALLMQLVQAAAELPPVECSVQVVQSAANIPTAWADSFWTDVVKKLPASRGARSEASAYLKGWLEALVEDLLAALPLPEWPGAPLLLRRLVLAINGDLGMRSADSGVKLVCVDLLGLLSRGLSCVALEADAPEASRLVSELVEAAMASAATDGGAPDPPVDKAEVVQQLLLEHLADGSVADGEAAGAAGSAASASSPVSSARQLIAVSMLGARVKALRQPDPRQKPEELEEQQAAEALLHYRQIYERQRSCLGTSTSGLPEVSREAAVALCRWLVADSVLGRSRATLLRWLADAGGGGRSRQDAHAAAVRAKAIKLLGAAIEADVRVLSMAEVQDGIKGALGDDSVLVREAAVDLIGKYISRSAELAVQYYDILVRASEDAGLTVRKRAIRLLWECCVRCPDFKHRCDALLRIVSRATDTEDTMRALVTKICAEIWFLPKIELEDEAEVSHVSRGPQQRAAQLGEVVLAAYCRMGSASNLPLHAQHPVIVTIRSIVGEDGKPECGAVRGGAREVADALLGRALELAGGADPACSEELFQSLLALHALCVADVRLLHRPADPQRLVRSLAPYIKDVSPGTDVSSRRRGEQLVVVLALLAGALPGLRHLEEALAEGLAQDLRLIVMRGSHVQAVSVACQCLCLLANLKPSFKATVRAEALRYYNLLDKDRLQRLAPGPQATGNESWRLNPRFMYILSNLCRHGADILDAPAEPTDGDSRKHPNCLAVLEMVLHLYRADTRVRDTAVQALGLIFTARPHLAVDVREVRPVLEGALDRSAPAPLKYRCLTALTELLRGEEEALLGRQAAARQEAAAAQQASTLPEAEGRALARRNGEGDAGSVSSGLVQMLWDRIVALATDTTPAPASSSGGGQTPPPTPSGAAHAHGTGVRRRALELIEVITRGGIVVPWSAIPALCALSTDPERDTAGRALACLRSIVAANTAFAAGQVPAGVAEAYSFHCRLAEVERPGQPPAPGECRALLDGLAAVWAAVYQPDRALKAKFLTALLNPLDDGCCLASGSAAKADPHALAFVAHLIAELPYKKMDELLTVLYRMNGILSRRAEAVLSRFQELRQEQQHKDDSAAAAKPSSSANAAHPPPPSPHSRAAACGLVATVKAAIAVSLMLLLKSYLRRVYDLTPDRVAKYEPTGPQRKVEEKLNAVHNGKLHFSVARLRVDVAARLGGAGHLRGAAGATNVNGLSLDEGIEEVYQLLKSLMKQDELDYRSAAVAADGEEAGPQSPPGETGGVAINLEAMMAAPDGTDGSKKPPLASRGRGRGGGGRGARGAAPRGASGRGRGRAAAADGAGGRGSTGAKRGRKRKARVDSDDESDGDGDSGGEEEDYKPRATKRRLDKAL